MTMNDFIGFLCFSIAAFVAVAIYVAVVCNDFHRRWQNLWRLLADVRSIRARRHGVGGKVNQHIAQATCHEQQIATRGARRNKGHALVSASDNFNGWPAAAAVNTVGHGLVIDENSRNIENQAQLQLNAAAGEYNALLNSFPRGWIGKQYGFRPWRLRTSSLRPRNKNRPSHRFQRPRNRLRRRGRD